jgi:predicted O-methyltransferase YrrM
LLKGFEDGFSVIVSQVDDRAFNSAMDTHRKPIYPYCFRAFSAADSRVLALLVEAIGKARPVVLELGSWLGDGSTACFIKELERSRGILYCVDTWRGNKQVPRHREIDEQYDVFATYLANVRRTGGEKVVKPMMMTSREAATIVSDHSFDLVFIDADHSYTSVKEDIRLWLPKVTPGGILCGHDCESDAEKIGLDVLYANRSKDAIEGFGDFPLIHPGPILAVYEAFKYKVRLWANELVELGNGLKGRSSIWSVVV